MAGWEVPSFTPLQGSGGSGGANRRGPRGGLAKGIPRKVWTPTSVFFTWTRLPRTCPVCVVRTGLAESWPVSIETDTRVESIHQRPSQATDVACRFLSSAQGTLIYKHLLYKFPAFNPVCALSPQLLPTPPTLFPGSGPSLSHHIQWDLAPKFSPRSFKQMGHISLKGWEYPFCQLCGSHEAVELWELNTQGSCP